MVQRVFNRIKPMFVVTKGCQAQLRDPKTKGLLFKGRKLATTSKLLAKRMNLPCSTDHDHVRCEGSLTRATAYYTEVFAKRVCQSILAAVDHHILRDELQGNSMVAETQGYGTKCFCDDVCHPKSDLQCSVCVRIPNIGIALLRWLVMGKYFSPCPMKRERERDVLSFFTDCIGTRVMVVLRICSMP